MKIDVHCHILPRSWPDLERRYGYGGFIRLEHDGTGCARMMRDGVNFRTVEPNLWDLDVRLGNCDRDGVDVQILSTVPVMFSYWAKPQHTLDVSQIVNDNLAESVQKHPRRFVGLGTLPMQDIDLACQELHRCSKALGFPGVEIGSNVNAMNLDDPHFEPFWEEAEKLGVGIFVHPWDMLGRDRMPNFWAPWLVSMPAETALAIVSVMMGGVLDRYPDLKLLFAHGGGSFPATLGRIEHGFRVRPDLCQTRSTTEPRDLLKLIYIDALVHDPAALEFVVELMGADHIALGTDYPFPLGELAPGRLIETSAFDMETKEQLLSQTALDFFGLDRANFETEASKAHSERTARGEATPPRTLS